MFCKKLMWLLTLFLVFPIQCIADDTPTTTNPVLKRMSFESAWEEIRLAVEGYLENHLSPPTRQQLYLSACRGLYMASHTVPPAGLSAEFSGMIKDEQFRTKLESTWLEMRKKSADPKVLRTLAMRSLFLGTTPEARFISAEENKVRAQLAENQYVGIGIQVALHDGYPMISKPFYGGAAYEAGAVEGDLIVGVDGKPTKGREFGKVIDQLRGAEGTKLTVTLRHKDESSKKNERDLEMVRAVIPIDSVVGEERLTTGKWRLTHSELPDDIAYLKVNSIVGSTAAELIAVSHRLEGSRFKGVVLDCRELNTMSSTEIHHANMVADVFLGEATIGELTTPTKSRGIKTQSERHFKDLPIVVLNSLEPMMNGPEFMLIAAMSNHDRAKIVGKELATNGICAKTIDLGDDGNAALQDVAYAIAKPFVPEPKRSAKKFSQRKLISSMTHQFPHLVTDARTRGGDFILIPDATVDRKEDSIAAGISVLESLR